MGPALPYRFTHGYTSHALHTHAHVTRTHGAGWGFTHAPLRAAQVYAFTARPPAATTWEYTPLFPDTLPLNVLPTDYHGDGIAVDTRLHRHTPAGHSTPVAYLQFTALHRCSPPRGRVFLPPHPIRPHPHLPHSSPCPTPVNGGRYSTRLLLPD